MVLTHDDLRAIAVDGGIAHIGAGALEPIFSTDEPELSKALTVAAVTIAQKDGLKTLMTKHTIAAYALYNLIADELALKAQQKLTKKDMRERAIATDALTKVSPAAIDAIFDKDEQRIASVKWGVAIQLATCGAMKETKTLQPVHTETAIAVFDALSRAIDIVSCNEDGEELQEDEDENRAQQPPGDDDEQ